MHTVPYVVAPVRTFAAYVDNLCGKIEEKEVVDLFGGFGQVESVVVPKKKGGEAKGWAFVNYYKEEAVKEAIEKLNGYRFGSAILRVEWPKKKGERNT